jgi:hypothetical protein
MHASLVVHRAWKKKKEKKTQTHEPREAHVPIPTFFFMVDQRVLDQKCIVKN